MKFIVVGEVYITICFNLPSKMKFLIVDIVPVKHNLPFKTKFITGERLCARPILYFNSISHNQESQNKINAKLKASCFLDHTLTVVVTC